MFARIVRFRHTSLISIHYVHKNALAHLKKILACIADEGFVLGIFSIETDSNDVLTWAISWAHSLGSWHTQVWGSMSIDSKNNMMEDVRVVSLYTRGWYECSKWMKSQCEFFPAPNAKCFMVFHNFCTLDHLNISHNFVKIVESSPFWIELRRVSGIENGMNERCFQDGPFIQWRMVRYYWEWGLRFLGKRPIPQGLSNVKVKVSTTNIKSRRSWYFPSLTTLWYITSSHAKWNLDRHKTMFSVGLYTTLQGQWPYKYSNWLISRVRSLLLLNECEGPIKTSRWQPYHGVHL